MEKIIHIIQFDFATTKKSLIKVFCSFLIFGLYFAFSVGNLTVIPVSMMMWVTLIAGLPFNVREKQGVDNLLITLPVNRRNIVRGRLLYAVLCGVLGVSISEILICILAAFANIGFTMKEITVAFSGGIFLYFLIISVQLPFYFISIHSQAIQLSVLFLYFLYVVGCQLYYINIDVNGLVSHVLRTCRNYSIILLLVTIVFSVILVTISYHLTCQLYDKKDL